MFALFGNLDFTELLVIAAAAIMIFGRRLPEVAVRGAAQLVRLRRTVTQMWRDAGIEDEIRRVRREIDRSVPRLPSADQMVREADRRRRALEVTAETESQAAEDEEDAAEVRADDAFLADGSEHNLPYERPRWPDTPTPPPDAGGPDEDRTGAGGPFAPEPPPARDEAPFVRREPPGGMPAGGASDEKESA